MSLSNFDNYSVNHKPMETLSCQELGERSCNFSATGEKDEEVAMKMLAHFRKYHPEKAGRLTDEELKRIFVLKARTIWTSEDFGIS
jgi:predicted small metal-binding protein